MKHSYSYLEEQAKTAKSVTDIFNIIEQYVIKKDVGAWTKYLGWGLPSKPVCQLVYDVWKLNPKSSILDLGSGSGLFSFMFNQTGIPAENIVAVEISNPSHGTHKQRNFWPIIYMDHYKVNPKDILFISWGTHVQTEVIDDYVKNGGWAVIILGDRKGATLVDTYLYVDDRFIPESYPVPGLLQTNDYISVYLRK